MKRISIASMISLIVILSVSGMALASTPAFVNISEVDLQNYPDMSIKFSTWDQTGLPLANLSADQVTIQIDDGNAMQPVRIIENTDSDLSVALVLDVSSSMKGQPITDAKNAATRFLDKLGKNDKAAVIAFSDDVVVDSTSLNPKKEIGFSSDLKNAYDLVENLSAGGGTEIYNAIEKAVMMTANLPAGHRAVLVFTDGKNDPANIGNPDSGISLAKKENIPVFVIGLGKDIDEKYLNQLTSETGGFYKSTPRSSELGGLFTEMATILKTSYEVTLPSTILNPQVSHVLKLQVNSSQGDASIQVHLNLNGVSVPTATQFLATETPIPSTPVPTTASPNPVKKVWYEDPTTLAILAAIVIVLVITYFLRKKRKPEFIAKCANCGTVLEKNGPCPMCGSTKRINIQK